MTAREKERLRIAYKQAANTGTAGYEFGVSWI